MRPVHHPSGVYNPNRFFKAPVKLQCLYQKEILNVYCWGMNIKSTFIWLWVLHVHCGLWEHPLNQIWTRFFVSPSCTPKWFVTSDSTLNISPQLGLFFTTPAMMPRNYVCLQEMLMLSIQYIIEEPSLNLCRIPVKWWESLLIFSLIV